MVLEEGAAGEEVGDCRETSAGLTRDQPDRTRPAVPHQITPDQPDQATGHPDEDEREATQTEGLPRSQTTHTLPEPTQEEYQTRGHSDLSDK